MTYGITRVHGVTEYGTSSNLTGTKGTFFSGYQPLYVKVQTVSAKNDFTSGSVNGSLESLVRAAETVGSVIGYGTPTTAASSSTIVLMFDGGSLNQGDGAGGQSGATTGLGALKSVVASALTAASTVDGNSATVATADFVCSVVGISGATFA
jgi:hypothetical protein